MNIFLSADGNYAKQLAVMITSIIMNLDEKTEVSFFILDGGISSQDKEQIINIRRVREFQIEFITIDENLLADCPLTKECPHIPIATYYRFLIPSLKPDLDKALFLDCDMTVVSDIRPLYEINIEGHHLAAAEEYADRSLTEHKIGLGIRKEDFYFNAGVMLINLAKWKQDNAQKQLLDSVVSMKDRIKFVDQDVLNSVFKNSKRLLPLHWNVTAGHFVHKEVKSTQYSEQEVKEAIASPSIIHFTGKTKPWLRKNRKHPLSLHYHKYLKHSGWPDPAPNKFRQFFFGS